MFLAGVVLAVTFIIFWMLELLPGDICDISAGTGATEEILANCRQDLHLNDNLLVRYGNWLGNSLTGDFGESYRNGIEVSSSLAGKLPVTGWLILYTIVLTLAISLPLGILSAYKRGSWIDNVISSTSFALLSIPAFVMGVVLALLFIARFRWFSLAGYISPTQDLIQHWRSLFLPALTLALGAVPIYVRLLRTDMIQNLEENYTTFVKAKGMPTRKLLLGHVLKPSSFTLVTITGINAAQLINSTLIVELIYDLDGVGTFLIDSVLNQDYLVVQSICALIAATFVVLNSLIDAVYPLLDPRVRQHGTKQK